MILGGSGVRSEYEVWFRLDDKLIAFCYQQLLSCRF